MVPFILELNYCRNENNNSIQQKFYIPPRPYIMKTIQCLLQWGKKGGGREKTKDSLPSWSTALQTRFTIRSCSSKSLTSSSTFSTGLTSVGAGKLVSLFNNALRTTAAFFGRPIAPLLIYPVLLASRRVFSLKHFRKIPRDPNPNRSYPRPSLSTH